MANLVIHTLRKCASLVSLCAVMLIVGIGVGSAFGSKVAASNAPRHVVEIEVAFDYAMSALQAGQPKIAIPVLQAILAEDPKLTRVRLELARAYFMAEQWARSREEFFRVLSGDLPEPVRKTVLAFIRQIDARRGVDWDLSVGFTTAGNSRDYDSETIHITTTPLPWVYDRPVERVPAMTANGTVNLRRQFGGISGRRTNTLGFASFGFDLLEAEGRTYDDQQLRAKFGLRFLAPKTTSSLAPFATTRWVGGERYEDQFGIEGLFERRNLMGGSAYGRLTYAAVDQHAVTGGDGNRFTALAGFRRSVGGSAIVGTELDYERRTTEAAFNGYEEFEWSVFAIMDVRNGWTLRPRVFLRYKDYLDVNPVYMSDPNEVGYGVRLRVEKSDMFLPGGYTPYFQIDAERSRSGIEAFSYRSVGVQLGFERRF